MLSLFYGSILETTCDYQKNHRFDPMDFCWQSNISAFKYAVQKGHSFSSKEQVSFDFKAEVTICSDIGAQENKVCPPKNNGGALNHNFYHVGNITGEGNENPLQYTCLENPMDREAWWAAVHGVTKSLTQLSD